MSSVYLIIRKDHKKVDGRSTIYLRYTDHKQVKKDISLRIAVHYDDWDDIRKQVKRGSKNHKEINLRINYHYTRAKKILLDAELKGSYLSADEFGRMFTNKPITDDFFEYATKEMDKSAQGFSKETNRTYKSQISKLKKFRSKIKIQDIDNEFIRDYENWMITVLKNKRNTYWKSLSWLKSVINRAIRDELVEKNPFRYHKLSKEPGTRQYLSVEEIGKLEQLYRDKNITEMQLNVLEYFLFACYTGLRYQDVKDLRYSNIDHEMIRISMHKTKSEVTIPLTSKASGLINFSNNGANLKVFRVITNQKTNENLKEIMKKAGISKSISFHCARHTFATIGITLGIPIEVISKLLGHGDLRTTQIYAKIVDNVKVQEMAKWDQI